MGHYINKNRTVTADTTSDPIHILEAPISVGLHPGTTGKYTISSKATISTANWVAWDMGSIQEVILEDKKQENYFWK